MRCISSLYLVKFITDIWDAIRKGLYLFVLVTMWYHKQNEYGEMECRHSTDKSNLGLYEKKKMCYSDHVPFLNMD